MASMCSEAPRYHVIESRRKREKQQIREKVAIVPPEPLAQSA